MRVPSSQHIGFNVGAAFALASRAVQEPGASPFSGHRGVQDGRVQGDTWTTGLLARFSTDSAGYSVYRRYPALQPSRQSNHRALHPCLTTSSGYLQVNELLMHLAGWR